MIRRIFAIILTAVLLSGCAGGSAGEQTAGYTFTDDLGRTVTVESCDRVAALLGSFADIWHLAGGSVCASPDDAWEDFDLPMAPDAVNLGNTKSMSLESLLGAKPELVLASTNTAQHVSWLDTLESAGITVAYFDVSDFDDYLRVLEICCRLAGNPERYSIYGTDVQKHIRSVLERNRDREPQSVLVMRASAASIRAKNSEGTVLGTMLRDFGCVNIADSQESLLENLSVESILLLDPDKIFFIQTGNDMDAVKENVEAMFRENPLWQTLTAVQKGEVYFMEKRLYNLKPNALWGEAYEKLEAILYGETES